MNTRPFGTFQLNRSNPVTKGLQLWSPLVELTPVDRVGRLVLTPTNTPLIIRLPERVAWSFVTASTQYFVTSSTPVTAVPITINAWFYPTQVASTKDIVSICNSADALNFFQLQHAAAAGVRARSGDSGGTSNATSSTNVVINTWQMATGVWLSTTSRSAYLNAGGKLTSTGSRTPTGVNRIGLGAQVSSSVTSAYGGYLADVGIWNRALSDDEIQSLYTDPWQMYDRVYKVFPGFTASVYTNTLSLVTQQATGQHGYIAANGHVALAAVATVSDHELLTGIAHAAVGVTAGASAQSQLTGYAHVALAVQTQIAEAANLSAIGHVALPATAAITEHEILDAVGHTAVSAVAGVSTQSQLNGLAHALLTVQTHAAAMSVGVTAGSLVLHQMAGLTALSALQAIVHQSMTSGLTLTEHAALTALQHQQLHFTATLAEQSRGSFEGTITLPLSIIELVQGRLTRTGTLGLNVNETLSAHGLLGANGQVVLASAVAVQFINGLDFLNHVTLHTLHQVLAAGVLDAINRLHLSVDPAVSVTSIVMDTTLVTPENRRLVVSLDSRKLTVAGEDRRFFVPAEYRKFLVRKKT